MEIKKQLCILCKTNKVSCFSACDNCYIGLCNDCENTYEKKISSLFTDKVKACNICKTNFYDFCAFCHNQSIHYMIEHKLNKLDKIKYENERNLLLNLNKRSDLIWDKLTTNEKNILEYEPNEFLKIKWNFCDCDNHLHCRRILQCDVKRELGISELNLYEIRNGILCTNCFHKEFNYEPSELTPLV